MSAADDMMRDKHGMPPRPDRTAAQPLNLLPIREAVKRHQTGDVSDEWLGGYAQVVIPALCDEIHRLREQVSDLRAQVTRG